jgi:hypothetical protein
MDYGFQEKLERSRKRKGRSRHGFWDKLQRPRKKKGGSPKTKKKEREEGYIKREKRNWLLGQVEERERERDIRRKGKMKTFSLALESSIWCCVVVRLSYSFVFSFIETILLRTEYSAVPFSYIYP